jgi:hypothetical protein
MPLELKNNIGKVVMMKLTFVSQPCSAKLAALDQNGLWFSEGDLAAAVEREMPNNKHAPPGAGFRQTFPWMFVPFEQIQWIAAMKA